jgi:hypothetical protein
MAAKGSRSRKLSLKNMIIYTLISDWPLSVRVIYNKVKTSNGIDVTYQAVFKAVRELVDSDVLVRTDKKYMINIGWINMVKDTADMVKKKYLKATGSEKIPKDTYFPDPRVTIFLREIGKRILDYFKNSKGCVIAVAGGGTNFGLGVKYYLSNRGVDVDYMEFDRHEIHTGNIRIDRKDVQGKKILVVDSTINSGDTMRMVRKKMDSIRKRYGIKDVKYAVGRDLVGLSDWCATRKVYLPVTEGGVLSIFW